MVATSIANGSHFLVTFVYYVALLGAALSVAPRHLSICLFVRLKPPIFLKQESHRNF